MYREVFEHSPDGIVVCRVDDDGSVCVVDANPAAERLTGLSVAQVRGQRLDEMVPPAQRAATMAAYRACLQSATRYEFHGQLRTPQGLQSMHITLTPVSDASGRVRRIVGVACGVSSVMMAATHRMSLLEAALDQVREAVYVLNEHGRPQYVNDEACRMLGYDRTTLLGLAVWDVDLQWSAQRWITQWSELTTRGQRKFDTLHRAKDGRMIPVEVVASHIVYQGRDYDLVLVRDITERKRAEQQFRALVEHSPDTVVRYDRDCRRVYANPALARATGIADEALLGRRPGELIATAPSVARSFEASVRAVLDTGRDSIFSLNWRGPLGERITTQIRLVAEHDPDNSVASVLAIGRDVSSLIEAEQTIRELHQRSEAAREEERRHIARELHDELGQHLSALRMEASLLRMQWGRADSTLREKVEGLQTAIDHVMQVVRDLASSLRTPALELGIAAALEWLIQGFRGQRGVDCRLRLDEAASAPDALNAEQTMAVFRVVQESLTNVARHAQASRVEVTLERRGSHCVLLVRDDGRGFDPAARSQRSLGLVGMRERAQMLGGRLEIRSSPGAGASISVTFPILNAGSRCD